MEKLSQHAFDRAEEIGDHLHHLGGCADLLCRELAEVLPPERKRNVFALLASINSFRDEAARAAAQIARSGREGAP